MAYDFNGTNQWMTTASCPVSGPPFTMACWFRSRSTTANQSLIHLVNTSTSSNFYYGLFADGAVAGDPVGFYMFDGNFSAATTTTGYSTNTWHHACGVASSNTSRTVYIDGGSSATATLNQSVTPSQIRIGRFVNSNNVASLYLNGIMAEVAVWNVALSAAEVSSLSKGVSCRLVRPQSLVFYAPLIRELNDVRANIAITNNSATVASHPRIYA